MEPTFLIQEHLPSLGDDDGPTLALYCTLCGHLSERAVEFVEGRPGDRMGCDGCGVVARLPLVQRIGV